MSHFSVMVIGGDVDSQLQPFHEFECTGVDDAHVVEVDITDRAGDYDYPTVTDEEQIDRDGPHKYGWALVDGSGEVVKACKRTNPNARWDWWRRGGRWGGMLLLKDGTRADEARKGDIDADGMRDEAAREAGALWDKAKAAAGQQLWHSWEHVRDVMHPGNIVAARATCASQPAREASMKATGVWDDDDVDSFLMTRDEYVARARSWAFVTFAVLLNGEWHERGSMGWWCMVGNAQPTEVWHSKIAELLDGLDEDVLITIVDCHI